MQIRLEEGELLVRSSHLMNGYFRNEEATAAALRGGWYHTGELAAVDVDGFVSILGRTAEVIRTGGEWVAPAEVDAVLQTHPAVAEVAVAGVPDVDWGEVVTAFVVVRPGSAVELDDRRVARGQHGVADRRVTRGRQRGRRATGSTTVVDGYTSL